MPENSTSAPLGTAPEFQPLSRDLLSLLEQLPDGVVVFDSGWRIVYANSEARRISRIPSGELPRETQWELYPETLGTAIERAYRQAMELREPGELEFFYPPFEVWYHIQIQPLGEGLALYYSDITVQKRAQHTRESALRQLHQVFEACPESIVCIDRQWNCTYANQVTTRFLRQDPVGKNLWKDFPGSLKEPFYSHSWTAMVQRTPTEFEAFYKVPEDVWLKVYVRPFEDGIILFSSDITAGKDADAQREAAARRLQQVFAATTDGVVALDREWKMVFLNPQAEQLLLPKTDLLGKNLWDEFPDAPGTDFEYHYFRAMNERIPSEFEAFYPAPLDRWLSISCQPSEEGIVVFFRDVTESRKSERLMREQQEILTAVQQASRVATWQLDLTTGALVYGPGSFPAFGRPLEEISTRQQFEDAVHPDHRARILDALADAIRTRGRFSMEVPILAPDGSTIWLEARGQFVSTSQNQGGAGATIGGMVIDITERKLNEQVLVESEARYRALTELNPQALWMGSAEGRVTYANLGFQEYIGIAVDASGESPWIEAFAPEHRQRVIDVWTHSVVTGEDYEIEALIGRASDRSWRWWNLRAVPVRNEAGTILYWLGVGNDIHDTKVAAEALKRQNEETERQRAELESIYENAPIGLALFDPVEFRYLRLNERQAQIVGLPKEQILGRTLTEIAPIEGLREMFEQVAGGVPIRNQPLEGALSTSPDEHRFWTVNYLPVYAPDGSVQAITAASLEITHQKKAEAALIQSEKLAAVGRLASSISHEINNPLEAVTNLLYLLALSDDLPAELKVYVHMAQSELARVSQIATQTLRFHRQAVRPTFVTAGELIGAVLNLYQGRLTNSSIRVDARYDTQTRILCFENDIRQVLNNLIANAIDAMRKGGRLIVRAHDVTERIHENLPGHDARRKGVRLTVADTGHGMSAEVLARVFEPFYTTKDLNGTGLGLWISKGIVQRHQGRLTVRSSEDPRHHGTIFSLFLPCEEDMA